MGKNGFLVAAGDVAGFSDRIERLIADADLRKAMGTAGAEIVAAQFSIETMVEKYHRIIEGAS